MIYKAFKQGPEIRGVIETVQHRTGLLMDSEMDEEGDRNMWIHANHFNSH